MHFKRVHSNIKNTKSRIHQSQVCCWFYVGNAPLPPRVSLSSLTNTRICIIYIKMNYCKAYLTITSWVLDSKGPKMAIELGHFSLIIRKKMAYVMLNGFSLVSALMGSGVLVLEACVFTSDFKILNLESMNISNRHPTQMLFIILYFIDHSLRRERLHNYS